MEAMNILLPDVLREFVDRQMVKAGYGTSSGYVRELIRRDQSRSHLRALLLVGAESALQKRAAGHKATRRRV